MRPKFYALLQACIEDGLDRGYSRAHKHTDNPTPLALKESQFDAIMLELNEWFDFEDTE